VTHITPNQLASSMQAALSPHTKEITTAQFLNAADLVLSNAYVGSNGPLRIPENEVVDIEQDSVPPTARRTHPANFELSFSNVLRLLALGAFTGASVVSTPWLIPFGVIVLAQELKEQFTIKFDEKAAVVLSAVAGRLADTNEHSAKSIAHAISQDSTLPALSSDEIHRQLEVLTRLGILECRDEAYVLVERMRVKQ